MRITIKVEGRAAELLEACCAAWDTDPAAIARGAIADAINAFNHERVDSRGLMTRDRPARPVPVGPELRPGEAERARTLARLAIETTTARGDELEAIRAKMRRLWPEGL